MFIKNKSPSKATKIVLFLTMALVLLLGSNVHAEGTNFSVTVPMELPIYMDDNGDVVTASNIQIVNNSDDSISVRDISVNALNNWNLIDYFSDFSILGNDGKYLGLIFNGDSVDTGGSVALNSPTWENVEPMTSLDIVYDGKLPLQTSTANNGQIAQVVFTIDWTELTGPVTHTVIFTAGTNGSLQGGSPHIVSDIPDAGTIAFPSPQPNRMYRFAGWMDLDTGQSVTESTVITKDMDIIAEFEELDPIQTVGNITMNIQTGVITGNTFSGTVGDLVIPDQATIEGVDYSITSISAGAFQGQTINSLLIPNGITNIGANAFNGCKINKNGGATIENYPGGINIDTSAFLNNHSNGRVNIYNDLTYTMQAPAGLATEDLIAENETLIITEEIDNELTEEAIEDDTLIEDTVVKDDITSMDEIINTENEETEEPAEDSRPGEEGTETETTTNSAIVVTEDEPAEDDDPPPLTPECRIEEEAEDQTKYPTTEEVDEETIKESGDSETGNITENKSTTGIIDDTEAQVETATEKNET